MRYFQKISIPALRTSNDPLKSNDATSGPLLKYREAAVVLGTGLAHSSDALRRASAYILFSLADGKEQI